MPDMPKEAISRKLQINDVILGGCGQACPDISKETIKT